MSFERALRTASLALIALLPAACREAPAQPPHIVLISADALRWDHLSMNGYARATSPRIDAFARRATHFSDAVTMIPKTGPSFTTLFTGLPVRRHGVDANRYAIPTDFPVLAEQLAEAGYQTAAFVSNPVLKDVYGYARGFETYTLHGEDDAMERAEREAIAWIGSAPFARPTFLWVHLIEPHGPYTPPASDLALFANDAIANADGRRVPLEYEPLHGFNPIYTLGAIPSYQRLGDEDRAAHYVAAYDAEIRRMDRAFGALVDALEARGVLDGAVVVFLSDHGESLGESDYWLEHGWFAFDGSMRVPLLLKAAQQDEARTVPGPVSLLDVAPTLLAQARVASPPALAGRDLLAAPPEPDEPVVIWNATTYPERYIGLRTPAWKYLRRVRPEDGVGAIAPRGAEELYDLRADPGETRDLASQQPEQVAARRDELVRRLAEMGTAPERVAPEVDAATEERLRALGYAK